jgi:uncharacterized protein DUF5995
VFAHAYSLMTRQIADDLPHTPGVNAEFVTELAEAFSKRYFDALEGDRATLSPAWSRAFELMLDRRTSVLEDLVFAMTVHIVHDLPLALGDVSPDRAPDAARIHEFHAVNDMMASSIDLIVDATASRYGRYVKWLDRLGHRYDNILTDYGVRMSRGLAWYNAIRLADEREGERARAAIERSPIALMNDIAEPPIRSVRVVLRVLRWLVSFLRTWPSEPTKRGMDVR